MTAKKRRTGTPSPVTQSPQAKPAQPIERCSRCGRAVPIPYATHEGKPYCEPCLKQLEIHA